MAIDQIIVYYLNVQVHTYLLFFFKKSNGHLHTDGPLSQTTHHIEILRDAQQFIAHNFPLIFLPFDISIFKKMFVRFKTMRKIHGMTIKNLIKHITAEFKEYLYTAEDISQCSGLKNGKIVQ